MRTQVVGRLVAIQAEAYFQQALARRQQAKTWELRVAPGLDCLWQQQGKCAEAHELLTSVYGWFTEPTGRSPAI